MIKDGQRGFSLVQVVVAMAIGSMVSIGIFQAINQGTSAQQRISQMNTYDDFVFEMKHILSDQAQCTAMMAGANLSTNAGQVNQVQTAVIPASRTLPAFSNSTWGALRYGSLAFSEALNIQVTQRDSATEVRGKIFFVPLEGASRSPLVHIRNRPIFARFTTDASSGAIVTCQAVSETDGSDDSGSIVRFRKSDKIESRLYTLSAGSKFEYADFTIPELPEGTYELTVNSPEPTTYLQNGSENSGRVGTKAPWPTLTEIRIDDRVIATVPNGTSFVKYENRNAGLKTVKVSMIATRRGNYDYIKNSTGPNPFTYSIVGEKVKLLEVPNRR